MLYLESIEGISRDEPTLLDYDQRWKNNAIYCLFAAQGSYLLSQNHLMIRCLAYLSKLTKKTVMTLRPLHISLCQREIIFWFQCSRKELTCFKEKASIIFLCLLCFVSGSFQDNMQISCLALGHILVESKSPLHFNDERHQFFAVLLKGTPGHYGCQNELLFYSHINGIQPNSFEVLLPVKSCNVVSAVGWLSKVDKTEGLISPSLISAVALHLTPILPKTKILCDF